MIHLSNWPTWFATIFHPFTWVNLILEKIMQGMYYMENGINVFKHWGFSHCDSNWQSYSYLQYGCWPTKENPVPHFPTINNIVFFKKVMIFIIQIYYVNNFVFPCQIGQTWSPFLSLRQQHTCMRSYSTFELSWKCIWCNQLVKDMKMHKYCEVCCFPD